MIFPIDWPEPFGIVMIEAMACGTPVLAFNRGSVREVVDDGITGFVVDSVDSAIATIPVCSLSIVSSVGSRFDERFTATRMAKSYVSLYARAFATRAGCPRAVATSSHRAKPR